MSAFGIGFTVIVAVSTVTQPKASPLTVYTVVDSGLSLTLFVFEALLHVYDEAPDTLKVPVSNGQIEACVIARTGFEINPTETVLLTEQLLASVAVSV